MKGITVQKFNGVLRKVSGLVVAALFIAGISSVAPASATAQSGALTINFHYQRTDQNFADWKAWVWCKDGSGNFGINLFQGSNAASGDCTKGAYVSLHSSSAVAEVVQEFTITDAVDVSQLGVIIYKHQGSGDVGNNTRDAQSKDDRVFDLVAAATDVVASDSVATFVTTEYVAPNPNPSDSPSPDPSASDSPSPDPSASDSASPSPASPSAPTGVVATPGNNRVSLKWDANPDAKSYSVYRDDVLIADSILVTQMVDTGVVNGTTYNYAVTATNDNGESDKSAIVSAKPLVVAKVPTIKSFSQSKSTKHGVGTVTIIGTNLAGATVKVGSLKATVKSSTATKLIFTIPAKASATTKGKFTITLGTKSVSSKPMLRITLK